MSAPGGRGAAMSRGWQFAATGLCAVGAIARLSAYAQHRSLWYDEAALALNVVQRGFIALLRPLDFLQAAPPLFLWAERVATLPAGANEWSLRAAPLAAGIATPAILWRVARRTFPPLPALAAVALVALSPSLVRYAAEAKPYAVDAFITVVLLDCALAVSESDASKSTRWILAVAGCVAIASSTPAIFVLAGIVAFFATGAVRTGDARRGRQTLMLATLWCATFVTLLLTVFRPLVGTSTPIGRFMRWYWATNFLTSGPPGLATKLSAILWATLTNTFLGEVAFPNATSVLLTVAVVGVGALIASRRFDVLVLLMTPLAAAAIASALRRYPLAERLLLFAAPLTALTLAASLTPLYHRRAPRRLEWLGFAVLVAGIAVSARGIVAQLASDEGRQESRALVREAMRQRAMGLPVWVSGGGEAAWRFYTGLHSGSRPSGPDVYASPAGGFIASDVIVGAWYNSIPERIVRVVDDTAAASRPSRWSETEAERIARLARPCALVFLSAIQPGEPNALLASVAALGGGVRESRRAAGAELHRVCFTAPGARTTP